MKENALSKLVSGGGVNVSEYGPDCTPVIVYNFLYVLPKLVSGGGVNLGEYGRDRTHVIVYNFLYETLSFPALALDPKATL
ncbi:hypothetical protein DCAR_0414882 [Daucus carota subsp. sativus]|uniref:Uncharacterized protein n=1 Tax=Daucus carota subsp. sativus TaxID=79200 RepID=A0AAF0WVR6_DAUCS|nr:hypothetical protein DCAR_0414882 [Daucus carota subsp. sativus]